MTATTHTRRFGACSSLQLLMSATVLALATSGCAVRHEKNRTIIGLDSAAVLGTERASFTLADGSAGALRHLGDNYSLKLDKYFKVIPLGPARLMELAGVQTVGDRSVLVINRLEKNGCIKTSVLAIRGSEVLSWLITPDDCKSLPEISSADNRLLLSYSGSRFVYDNGRLIEQKAVAHAQPNSPAPAAKPANKPAPPVESTSGNRQREAASGRPRQQEPANAPAQTTQTMAPAPTPGRAAPVNATNTTASRTVPSTPDLVFSSASKEQKPVVINLE